MKISFILASLWLSGGERMIVETINRLSQRGHDITVVMPGGTLGPDLAELIDPSISIIQTKMIGSRSMGLFSSIRLTLALSFAVPASEVIITTYTPTTIAGFIASRILRKGKLAWLFMDFPEMFDKKPLFRWIAQLAPRWHDVILALSEHLKEEVLSHYPAARVIVTRIALSKEYQPLEEISAAMAERDNSKKNILYLGDKRPRKGLADFLEAAKLVVSRHPEIFLWVVLKNDDFIECELPHQVFFRPPNAELAHLYATCDVYVSSSWREGFGLPPLEAMACGAPVVMTESGGGREYARNGENCLLVPPRSPGELANAIVKILEDRSLEMILRKNGPLTASSFNWENVISRIEGALSSLVQD